MREIGGEENGGRMRRGMVGRVGEDARRRGVDGGGRGAGVMIETEKREKRWDKSGDEW